MYPCLNIGLFQARAQALFASLHTFHAGIDTGLVFRNRRLNHRRQVDFLLFKSFRPIFPSGRVLIQFSDHHNFNKYLMYAEKQLDSETMVLFVDVVFIFVMSVLNQLIDKESEKKNEMAMTTLMKDVFLSKDSGVEMGTNS